MAQSRANPPFTGDFAPLANTRPLPGAPVGPLDGQRSGTVMRFGTSGKNHRLSCTVSYRDFLPEGGNSKHLKCLHGTHLHNPALRCCVRSYIACAQQPTHPQAPHNQSPLRRGDARASEPTDRPADCRVPRRSGEGGSPSSVREEEGPFYYRWRSAKTRSGEADLRSAVAPTLTACSKGRPERGLGCRRALRGDKDTPPSVPPDASAHQLLP